MVKICVLSSVRSWACNSRTITPPQARAYVRIVNGEGIMNIEYRINEPISARQFVGLLKASTLAERRPIDDVECMQGMLANASLIVTAWDGEALIGVARSVTDFHYACYLSDLAVHLDYQRSGIGKRLQSLTQDQLGPNCKLILLAAPAANAYYQGIGFTNNQRCWVLERHQKISR